MLEDSRETNHVHEFPVSPKISESRPVADDPSKDAPVQYTV
jgi:hypothetical protein